MRRRDAERWTDLPISKEKRALYPAKWREISKRVREAAGNKCQKCGAPNGQLIARGTGEDSGTYMLEDGAVFDAETGEPRRFARGSEYSADHGIIVVLTCAHLDHDPQNNVDSNLRAWCQRCHLAHDQQQHIANARETRRKRKAAGNLPGVE